MSETLPGQEQLQEGVALHLVIAPYYKDPSTEALYIHKARLRVSVDNDAHLFLRLTLQNTETILEDVYTERVQKAQALLGNQFSILRAG